MAMLNGDMLSMSEDENDYLRKSLESIKAEKLDLQQQLLKALSVNKSLFKELELYQKTSLEERSNYGCELSITKEKVKWWRTRFEGMDSANKALLLDMHEVVKKNIDLKKQNSTLKNETETLRSQLRTAQDEIENLTMELEDLDKDNADLENQYLLKEEELMTKEDVFEKQLEGKSRELKAVIALKRVQECKMKTEIEKLRSSLREHERCIDLTIAVISMENILEEGKEEPSNEEQKLILELSTGLCNTEIITEQDELCKEYDTKVKNIQNISNDKLPPNFTQGGPLHRRDMKACNEEQSNKEHKFIPEPSTGNYSTEIITEKDEVCKEYITKVENISNIPDDKLPPTFPQGGPLRRRLGSAKEKIYSKGGMQHLHNLCMIASSSTEMRLWVCSKICIVSSRIYATILLFFHKPRRQKAAFQSEVQTVEISSNVCYDFNVALGYF